MEHEEGVPFQFLLTPPHLSEFFSYPRHAPSLAPLLVACLIRMLSSQSILMLFLRAHRQKIKLKFICCILHVTDFKGFFLNNTGIK